MVDTAVISRRLPEPEVLDAYIESLRFRRFAAYVVPKVAKEYGLSRDEAEVLWVAHMGRREAK